MDATMSAPVTLPSAMATDVNIPEDAAENAVIVGEAMPESPDTPTKGAITYSWAQAGDNPVSTAIWVLQP